MVGGFLGGLSAAESLLAFFFGGAYGVPDLGQNADESSWAVIKTMGGYFI